MWRVFLIIGLDNEKNTAGSKFAAALNRPTILMGEELISPSLLIGGVFRYVCHHVTPSWAPIC